MKTIIAVVVAAGLVLLGAGFYAAQTAVEPPANLRTAKIERGDLSRTIKAEGTVKLEQVEVGAQVTGMIAAFEADPDDPKKQLDCGSRVKKGMVLARIDPTIYQAQVDCAEAAVLKTKANLLQSQARRDQTEQEWKRAEKLRVLNAIADTDYDVAMTNFRMAAANVAVWNAAVQETEAALRISKTNLDYTIIRSPCDGVILDRRVNEGQTVVAAFNAPGLFLIAKDSRQMQVWASVDEADIGYIRPGLAVRFTVSACFDECFQGRVAQIRSSPTKRQNTIAYTVVVAADHFGRLLPDMTANLQFEIERHANVLLIPNDALRWPTPENPEIQTTAGIDALAHDSAASEELARARTAARFKKELRVNRRLWVRDGSLLRPVEVQAGVSNGLMTEITGTGVREGMEIVWGELCMQDRR
jgi:HlyD family secretion protein